MAICAGLEVAEAGSAVRAKAPSAAGTASARRRGVRVRDMACSWNRRTPAVRRAAAARGDVAGQGGTAVRNAWYGFLYCIAVWAFGLGSGSCRPTPLRVSSGFSPDSPTWQPRTLPQ
ncbi:hypothetical protein Sxan_30900 [Streptomyces xanthophaeus]|uniref:Uncharacterized protein n=1 Tax=Streptomyces xanthophaeus TaxID=67385 RepID=A0A919GW27_9ACTN|nr:hypothetical protein Sxan_30900 [Streptomyces xanthophaeus]